MTLTEFLLARIAEDEAGARAAHIESLTWWVDGPAAQSGRWWVYATGEKFADRGIAEHIARHDPARVLAECEAKRGIVGLYSSVRFGEGVDGRPVPLGGAGPEVYWEAVCILALPYADHEDYRDEWKP